MLLTTPDITLEQAQKSDKLYVIVPVEFLQRNKTEKSAIKASVKKETKTVSKPVENKAAKPAVKKQVKKTSKKNGPINMDHFNMDLI